MYKVLEHAGLYELKVKNFKTMRYQEKRGEIEYTPPFQETTVIQTHYNGPAQRTSNVHMLLIAQGLLRKRLSGGTKKYEF